MLSSHSWWTHVRVPVGAAATALAAAAIPATAFAAEGGRRIEEVVVTAEKRESTVQDTSLSITAFDASFLEDFGLRNQEDLQNFIPATTIQPYDVAIRGIGRNFRTVGGDPGVSTYLNGVYSEDFGIASTEGGLYDIERIEVLRGPQGTLYGRNAVGGAINFINSKPTQEFSGEGRAVFGSYALREFYGFISGPIFKDVLAAKFTGSKRTRDGYIQNLSGQNINNYGDENYALSLRFTPIDSVSVNMRVNERSYARRFNGGAGSNPIWLSQGAKSDTNFGGRTTDRLAYGHRIVDPTITCVAQPLNPNCDGGAGNFQFTNAFGTTRTAEQLRPGVDPNGTLSSATDPDGTGPLIATSRGATAANSTLPNYAFGAGPNLLSPTAGGPDLDGDDLVVSTNGDTYDEFFDHQAIALDATWDIADWLSIKYVFGYTDYFYDRNTEEDGTGSARLGSYDFYVLQENENWQHEVQFFIDFERVSITSGIFFYDAHIDQRLDLYDHVDTQGRFQNDANYGVVSADFVDSAFFPRPFAQGRRFDIRDAQRAFEQGLITQGADGTATLIGAWYGDKGDRLESGAVTPGTFFAWDNIQDTEAFAFYTQFDIELTEKFSADVGIRYAKDDKKGQERILTHLELAGVEAFLTPLGSTGAQCPTTLCEFNVARGALTVTPNADGTFTYTPNTNPGETPTYFNGLPAQFVSYLPLEDDFDKVTWRVNLDYTPDDDQLIYASVTAGWRSGGFNQGFRSIQNPVFGPEEVIAYEIGYKGQLFENKLQLNMSLYYYDYQDIQIIVNVVDPTFGEGTAVTNAPSARTIGWEGEVLWLATDQLTVGGNWSYTNAEYDESFLVVDTTNPETPGTLFSGLERNFDVDGNKLNRIPEWKFTMWANYNWQFDRYGKVDVYTTLGWTDSFFFSPFNTSLDESEAFLRLDARVTWTSPDEALSIAGFVNNITDELGIRQYGRYSEQTNNFARRATTTDPRVFGVEMRYKFGAFR